jgi:hypothetical protein
MHTRAKLNFEIAEAIERGSNPIFPTTRSRKKTIKEDILDSYHTHLMLIKDAPRRERIVISRGLAIRKIRSYPP